MFSNGVVRNAPWVAACVAVIADAASTEHALESNPNAIEANPIMAPFVNAGLLWPVTFLTVALFVFFSTSLWRAPRRHETITATWTMFLLVAVVRTAVTLNNLSVAEATVY